MTENWYLVLELEFDPNPVEDEAVIEAKIEEKRKLWSSKANDFNKGAEYKKYLQQVSTIKKDMLGDENIRKELIQNACERSYESIDKVFKQICKKGTITAEVISKMANSSAVNATEKVIRHRAITLGIKIEEISNDDFKDIYEKYYKKKPNNASAFDGMKSLLSTFSVNDLYEFLYKGTSVKNAHNQPCDALRQKASEKKKKEFYKNDAISGAGSKLCAQCELAFKDDKSKEIYDLYLEYNRRKLILDDLKEMVKLSGELNIDMVTSYTGQLTEIFKDRNLAEKVLIAFCKIEKIPMPAVVTENTDTNSKVKICRCGCINDVSDGRSICQNCGLELEIKCPKCTSVNNANIKVCKCGFKFENIDKAIALCELVESELDTMEFEVAKAHLSTADKFWPGSSKVKAVLNKVKNLETRVGNSIKELKEYCANKQYYEANKRLLYIKTVIPNFQDIELENKIATSIRLAQDYVNKAKKLVSEKDILETCAKAYNECSDLPGVREIIAKYPPKEPTALKVVCNSTTKMNILSWEGSKSEGNIYYTVVRKEGAIPVSIQDGYKVGRVSMCGINDSQIVSGVMYYYAIFAERSGIYSEPLVTQNPVKNLFEISNAVAIAGKSYVQLEWGDIPKNATVEIYKVDNSGKEEKIECNNSKSFIDKDLQNDVIHTYRLCLSYNVLGQKISTPGVKVSAIPTQPPQAVDNICVRQMENDVFEVSWENNDNNQIQFFYSEVKPQYDFGEIVSLKILESKMLPLILKKNSETSGTFVHKNDKSIYIVPVVVKRDSAVIGDIKRATKGERVSIKHVNVVNGKIHLGIDAPKNARGFVVLYRNDRYPTGISDVNTTRKYIPAKQYEFDSALVIDSNESQNYYFAIYAEFINDGEKDYSAGAEYEFSNTKKQEIKYSVTVLKKLFGSRIIVLEFESENKKFKLPAIDIVSCVGMAPMFKKSAKLLYEIKEQEVNGTVKIKIPLDKSLSKETYIKAFLKDSSLQKYYQLKLKINSNLKIS